MASEIKIKRSAVGGKIPQVSDLQLGELAINTYDGKLYAKRNNGTESIVEFGSDDYKLITVEGQDTLVASQKSDTLNITKNDNGSYENLVLTTTQATDTLDFSFTDTPEFDSLKLNGGTGTAGTVSWSTDDETYLLDMGGGVMQSMGEELYYPKQTYNNTGVDIPNGTPVMAVGGTDTLTYIAPAIADGSIPAHLYMGLATETIAAGSTGRVTFFGAVNDIDTSDWAKNTLVYVDTTAGGLTSTVPSSPNLKILAGIVTYQSATEGRIFVRCQYIPNAAEVTYDNTASELAASNIKSALDELQATKLGVGDLSTSLALYPTTASSDVTGYNRLVSAVSDPDFDETAVSIPTGAITTADQLCGQLISDAGLLEGNPGTINVTTLGNIMKTDGNTQQNAYFYYTVSVLHEDLSEDLLCTSGNTDLVTSPNDVWKSFNASASLPPTTFVLTDRIITRYYATYSGVSGAAYAFQFGDGDPVKTLLPVPVNVIPPNSAEDMFVDTTNFNGILSSADANTQLALDTIDDNAVPKARTITAQSGLTGGGTLENDILIEHDNTSSVADLTATTNTYVDGLTFDGFGHVTEYTTSSVPSLVVTSDNEPLLPNIGIIWEDTNYDPAITKIWNGSEWVIVGTVGTTYERYNYVVGTVSGDYDGVSLDTFPVSYTVGLVEVFLEGLKLLPSEYTATDSATIVLNSPAEAGDAIEIICLTPITVALLEELGAWRTGTAVTSTTEPQVVDTFATADYFSAEYLITVSDGTNLMTKKLVVQTDGTTALLTSYAELGTNLGDFDVQINGTDLELLMTPTVASTGVKFKRQLISSF